MGKVAVIHNADVPQAFLLPVGTEDLQDDSDDEDEPEDDEFAEPEDEFLQGYSGGFLHLMSLVFPGPWRLPEQQPGVGNYQNVLHWLESLYYVPVVSMSLHDAPPQNGTMSTDHAWTGLCAIE